MGAEVGAGFGYLPISGNIHVYISIKISYLIS